MAISDKDVRDEHWNNARRALESAVNELPTTGDQRQAIDDAVSDMARVYDEANDN